MFIDELYIVVGVGFGGGNSFGVDVGNLLKLMLVCGELCCIGVIIIDEYCKYIEKDVVLECWF